VHVGVALDHLGRRLGALTLPTSAKGYEELLSWAEGLGPVRCVGMEGTSSYGAGLARHLKSKGIEVLEVERPKRRQLQGSRRNGNRPTTPMLRLPPGPYPGGRGGGHAQER
jgi:transposase